MIIIDDIDQQSEEWDKIRAGIPTASGFSRIVKKNGDPSDSRQNYLYELAGERITGFKEEGYTSWDMKRGIEREHEARLCYEHTSGDIVRQVGFVFLNEDRQIGCSPDGLIIEPTGMNELYTDKGLEIKCPSPKNQVSQLLNGGLPPDKFQQIHGSMWVCGLHSWEFIAYCRGMDPFLLTVQRDYKFTAALEFEIEGFLEELDEVTNKLKGREL